MGGGGINVDQKKHERNTSPMSQERDLVFFTHSSTFSPLPPASSMHLLHVSRRKGKRRRHERVVKGRQVEQQPLNIRMY